MAFSTILSSASLISEIYVVFSLYVCVLSLLLHRLPILFMSFEGVYDIWFRT